MNTPQPKQLQSIRTTQRLDKAPYKNRGCETPSPRPIKKSRHTELNKPTHGMFNILKSAVVPLPPQRPHHTLRCKIPNIRRMLTKPIPPTNHLIQHTPKHYPINSKHLKDKAPNLIRHLTM